MSDRSSLLLPEGFKLGSYEIQSVLGAGGFGITYQAYDHVLNQLIAIKEYFPYGVAARQQNSLNVIVPATQHQEIYAYGLDRFLSEARALAKFKHPNIIRVIQFLQANQTAYLIMDFEKGKSLAQVLKQLKTLSEAQVLATFIPLLKGLQHIHSHDFLHRDIKPANIIIRDDNSPVLIDFGSARQALNQNDLMLTAMVTPGYAPFEQYFNDEQQGISADLYSLGATLFHAMTGEVPLVAIKRMALSKEQQPDPVYKKLQEFHNVYSKELMSTVEWLLQVDAANRPKDIAVILQKLATITVKEEAQDQTLTQSYAESIAIKDDLKGLRDSLAEEIGPIADTLLKKVLKQESDLSSLTKLLAEFIPTEERRKRFLSKHTNKRSHSVVFTGASQAAAIDLKNNANTLSTVEQDNEFIDKVKSCLTLSIGPIAPILVKKTLKEASTRENFIEKLCIHINNPIQVQDFLRRMKL
ncbi:serine/threonine protein kinase [Thiolinea disciformis]|uniref:serine/threonine protein kinase n=1 Tax=Thiolinea disciformis TaxID=125614 RepID=UPI00036BDCEA|nr:serine/threonine-protein kinase [Thiolinea disciformis]